MPRLTSVRARRPTSTVPPAAGERGAVAVMTALLMVVLIGFAAIAVDVAALWSERQQLQTAADAAALAVAQDCAAGTCGTPTTTARTLTTANAGAAATAAVVGAPPTPGGGTVTVSTSGVSTHWFAPVLGVDESTVSARATASWGGPSAGTAVLPLAFSWCEFQAQTGGGLPSGTTERTIFFTKSSGTSCTGPSGNVVPGGFGWLTVNAGSCRTSSSVGEVLWSSPGESVPSGCTTTDFAAVQDQTVLLPLYDQAGSSGSNAWYRLYGYAAFRLTGYHFVGQYSWSAAGTCKGNVRCIQGYFVRIVELDDSFTLGAGAPRLGASVVALTN
ncbi:MULTISPECIES: pilus assembly protein TadG-related protein [unclassified Isoptericola]|uniref:pilus assembly protein TadG-related protein n=1 Tax=Isoptericola sp. NPDC057191 TaxID=3346041 RepID=UPI003644339B